MVKKKKDFNTTEKQIIRYLYYTKLDKSASQVASKVGITYPTAKKYLDILVKLGVVLKKEVPTKRKLKNVKTETLYHFDMRRSPK